MKIKVKEKNLINRVEMEIDKLKERFGISEEIIKGVKKKSDVNMPYNDKGEIPLAEKMPYYLRAVQDYIQINLGKKLE